MQKSYVSRAGKVRHYESSHSHGPELENHFILRLLEPQAKILREDIREGKTNIKDRLFIQLDHTQDKDDMRNGVITFDTIMYKARLVDLPTILETWKSIDSKNFYKTADISQMLMVVNPDDPPEEEDVKKKKKDPSKLDKKYIWPHGYTPPLKNVRKRRFRKMLRKKTNLETMDLPDIEKEVRRLLRTDFEAVGIKWEIIKEDDKAGVSGEKDKGSNLDKQELFGELSSSEDELGGNINIMDEDDDSRMSVDDSRSFMHNEAANSPNTRNETPSSDVTFVTEFTSSMFQGELGGSSGGTFTELSNVKSEMTDMDLSTTLLTPEIINELYAKLSNLESELEHLLSLKAAQEAETSTIENVTLKEKFLEKLVDLELQINGKQEEIKEIRSQLMMPQ